MLCVIAMPCLNEGSSFLASCASLGFEKGKRPPPNVVLVLVDNGSDDDTWHQMRKLEQQLPEGSVASVQEFDRGYIAARRAGADEALRVTLARNVEPLQCLLLQADADTVYSSGYVEAMRGAAAVHPANIMFEGRSEAPDDPQDPIRRFQEAEQAADADVAEAFVPDDLDVIVDDKVAAYRLADYYKWGEHQQEFDRSGDEILAETSRLFIKARGLGARRVRVEGAVAYTSTRRILEAPDIAFATAGYPRTAAWKALWRARYKGPTDLQAFEHWPLPDTCAEVVAERRRHVLGMFVRAPLALRAAITRSGGEPVNTELSGSQARAATPGALLAEAIQPSDPDTR